MAEAYLNHYANGKALVYSAGIETHGVNPLAIKVLKEDGIDISQNTSNNIEEYKDIEFDYVITVCDNAKEQCPIFPSHAMRFHQNFPYPARVRGNSELIFEEFRSVRNKIKTFCKTFVKEYI